ncbi:MAG: hypothetical protein NTW19_03090 [Planctomycetota bacterium]|nr:hypothetical protein [Planctomycetota bacterium]
MPQDALFPAPDDELLISVYQKQGRTLDDLPYTEEFERIYQAAGADLMTRPELFRRLHNLRKAAKLPRLGRAVEAPPRIPAEAERTLAKLVEAEIGRLSLRDQLPHTDKFDQIVGAFNAQAGLNLSAHAVWRLVAKMAK